jgi:hypothetical protein
VTPTNSNAREGALDWIAAARRLICARCGAAFDCGLGRDCWCAGFARLPMPAPGSVEDCLCPACLRAAASAAAAPSS